MIIAFKESNKVYIIRTRIRHHYIVKHPSDEISSQNVYIHRYPNQAILINSQKPRMTDLIKDKIDPTKKLSYDNFYLNDYKDIKTFLKYYLILNPDYTNPAHLDDEYVIYAKGSEFIMIHQFKTLVWGEDFFSSTFHNNLKSSFYYHKDLPVEKRIVQMMLNLMDHSSNNYFPIHITHTRTNEIKTITLKEALCQYDLL
jgi:hypothetical protein